jgi:hypothetical protein
MTIRIEFSRAVRDEVVDPLQVSLRVLREQTRS